MSEPISRPAAGVPSASQKQGDMKPSDYNPAMAEAEMVRDMIARLPNPAIVSQKFTVFHGLVKALNHTPDNPTYINTSLLCILLDKVADNSVNIDGWYIKNLFAYFMHPNYVIQGMPSAQITPEEKPTIGDRIRGWFGGKSSTQQQGGKPNG